MPEEKWTLKDSAESWCEGEDNWTVRVPGGYIFGNDVAMCFVPEVTVEGEEGSNGK